VTDAADYDEPSVESQLAELRVQIATLIGRRLADHPAYRAWLTHNTFEVDGVVRPSAAFVERDVVVRVAADGQLTVVGDAPPVVDGTALRMRQSEEACIYAVSCTAPDAVVTLTRGGTSRPLFACTGAGLSTGRFVRATFMPMHINHVLAVTTAAAPLTYPVTVVLHTLMQQVD
jgi:hypothetical protein